MIKIDPETAVVGGGCASAAAVVVTGVSSNATGPGIAAGAAIVVALVTAWTTNRRLERQLSDERDRLQLQLDAEADREQLRLDHERKMEDMRALRELVEAALSSLTALELSTRASPRMAGLRADDVAQQRSVVLAVMHRLNTRLVSSDPIYLAFDHAFGVLDRLWRARREGATEDEVQALHAEYVAAYRDLATAGRQRTVTAI